MSTPILATKLYSPPPRARAVLRPRLMDRLNDGLHSKLVLISAPAGFGKTTLVSAWIEKIERPAAWLSLDEKDNDLTRFLTYFVHALQTIAPTLGAGLLGVLQSHQTASIESMLTVLLNEINTISDIFILVLDDYHVIDAAPIDDALAFLVEHLPPHMLLVITTRDDPQLPVARLRARGQLTEVRASDLRFTPAETAEFLNHVMRLDLSAQDIATLETRTEGWIAGLQLAAISLQGQQDTSLFIQSFTGSHHFVLDYLVEEVLQQQSEAAQKFLVYTSVLKHMCGELCDAIMPSSTIDGQTMLENIERANLLIVPLDNTRQWYRYHHLFADVLQTRLQKEYPDQVCGLHQRASKWYEQNGFTSDAIHHACAAEDFGRAAQLLELAFPSMDENLQSSSWLDYAKLLPAALIEAMPVLNTAYAWALLNRGNLEAARVKLEAVERLLAAPSAKMMVVDQAQFRLLPASIATAYAYHAQALGNVPDTIRYTQQVLSLLPETDLLRRGQAQTLLGLSYWASGDLEAAQRMFSAFMDSMRNHNIPEFISVVFVVADINIAFGRLREALSVYTNALELVANHSEPIAGVEHLYRGISELQLEWGDLETAIHYLQTAEQLGKQAALPDWEHRLRVAQARIADAQGDRAGALALLDAAERFYVRTPLPEPHPLAALKVRIWVKQNNLDNALIWVRNRGLHIDDEIDYLSEFEYITLARVLIAQYRRNLSVDSLYQALKLLERVLTTAEAGKRTGTVIEIHILQALAYEALAKIPEALKYLERALILAEPEGYVRLFINEGAPMARLLDQDRAYSITVDYTQTLLAAFAHDEKTKQAQPTVKPAKLQHPQPDMIERLSERELEVLHRIAEGLANSEIAERLFISKHTVKVHSRNIFSKLDVHTRTQAVAKARSLGILKSN